jgi:hypothetical protein
MILNYGSVSSRVSPSRVTFNAAVFFSDIRTSRHRRRSSCSHRPQCQAESLALSSSFSRPSENWDFGLTATYVQAEITETRPMPPEPHRGSAGNRLPTAPEFRRRASYSWPWSPRSTARDLTLQRGLVVRSCRPERRLSDSRQHGAPPYPGFFAFGAPTINQFSFPTALDFTHRQSRFGVGPSMGGGDLREQPVG